MLYLVLPLGNDYGWGVCGNYLTKRLAKWTSVRLFTNPFGPEHVGGELDYLFLKDLCLDQEAFLAEVAGMADPVIQGIRDHSLVPVEPRARGRFNIGYTFFERSVLAREDVDNARQAFDVIVAGSTWCENVLRTHGLHNTCTIIQGVDRALFNPCGNDKSILRDRFVVFSGGKFEFRKGQDLVIRAFKVLQDRHEDVLLVAAWYNPWNFSLQTMSISPHITFKFEGEEYRSAMEKLITINGIDGRKVVVLPPKPNATMAAVYKNTDCGIFPNRCEGGTNLVLMEYMACGKPAIVSNSSGHRDVAHEKNSCLLKNLKPVNITEGNRLVAVWDEPDLDEIVDRMEWAYQNRGALDDLGRAAAQSMETLTWDSAARQFYRLAHCM
ncbi:MAG: glycosyltransferase family 4 protein [Pseudomonadota bacterium]